MASQNIVVVGGGAMGSIFAAGIAQAGHEVVVLDVAADLVDAINAHGLLVESGDAKVVTMVPATTDPYCLNTADAALVFVKAHHTAAVAQALGAHRGQNTAVVTLQNGWGNAERLAETVPVDHLVMGVTYHSGTVASAASVAHTGRGPTFVGPYQVGGDITLAEEVSTILSGSGFNASATGDIRTQIWNKLVLNAATLPVAATTGLRAAEMLDSQEVATLVEALADEALSVASKMGLNVDPIERQAKIKAVLAGAGMGKPSMLQDIEARRKTEIEVVNGAVVRTAAECGADVPLNVAMCALVHGIERSWSR
jgi:2-dehydropantoate 2-reductase